MKPQKQLLKLNYFPLDRVSLNRIVTAMRKRPSTPRLATGFCPLFLYTGVSFCLIISLLCFGDETSQPVVPVSPDTNSQEILRAVQGLQDQLRVNQTAIETAIEQNTKATREAVTHNAELLSNGLQTAQETFAARQQAFAERTGRELQLVQDSSRAMVLVGGIFAAVASLVLLVVGYFQWRISKAWTQISGILRGSLGLGFGALGQGGAGAAPVLADSGNSHLLNVLQKLETRV